MKRRNATIARVENRILARAYKSVKEKSRMGAWCSPVNTSPCHGEDRGFESLRTRQDKHRCKAVFVEGECERVTCVTRARDSNAGAMSSEHARPRGGDQSEKRDGATRGEGESKRIYFFYTVLISTMFTYPDCPSGSPATMMISSPEWIKFFFMR